MMEEIKKPADKDNFYTNERPDDVHHRLVQFKIKAPYIPGQAWIGMENGRMMTWGYNYPPPHLTYITHDEALKLLNARTVDQLSIGDLKNEIESRGNYSVTIKLKF